MNWRRLVAAFLHTAMSALGSVCPWGPQPQRGSKPSVYAYRHGTAQGTQVMVDVRMMSQALMCASVVSLPGFRVAGVGWRFWFNELLSQSSLKARGKSDGFSGMSGGYRCRSWMLRLVFCKGLPWRMNRAVHLNPLFANCGFRAGIQLDPWTPLCVLP